MKKLICLLMTICCLCGCNNVNQQTPENTEATAEQKEDITYTRDDFTLYTNTDSGKMPVVWLGMTEDYVNENKTAYREFFEGLESLSFNTQNVYENEQPTEDTVNYIGFFSYMGSREYLETQKGIRTSGFYDTASKPNSTAEEVIKAYDLKPEEESIYIGDATEDNYTIALYFDIDSENQVKRIILPEGSDISDISMVENADYFIKFMITQNQVTGIQMYRKQKSAVIE